MYDSLGIQSLTPALFSNATDQGSILLIPDVIPCRDDLSQGVAGTRVMSSYKRMGSREGAS